MGELIRRSVDLYQTEGVRGLLSGISRFIWFHTPLRGLYWTLRTALARGHVVLEVGGIEVTFRVSTKLEMIRLSTFVGERELLRDIINEVDEEDVFWDVGANVGLYSCFAGRLVSDTIAFEPEPTNVSRLRENISINGIDCRVFELALGNSSGTVDLAIGDRGEGGVHAIAVEGESGAETVPVTMERGDKLVEIGRVPPPTAVKIDVEGAEAAVLDGMTTILREEACRLVYVEVHTDELIEFGWEEGDLYCMLEEAGFEVEELIRRTETSYHLKATKPPKKVPNEE